MIDISREDIDTLIARATYITSNTNVFVTIIEPNFGMELVIVYQHKKHNKRNEYVPKDMNMAMGLLDGIESMGMY